MPVVHFTRHLARFFPDLPVAEGTRVDGATVAEIVAALDRRWPGLAGYVVDERGALRQHVNIFVRGELVVDRRTLSDPVGADDELHVIQALSGG